MYKRFLAVFSVGIFLMGLMTARLSVLCTAEPLLTAAQQQSASVIMVASTRGTIYDRKLRPLTGIKSKNIAAILPNEQAADVVMRDTPIEKREELSGKLQSMYPFLWEVQSKELYAKGLEVFKVPQRYLDEQPAVHIIGQIDTATGRGASGLEKAYDDMLCSMGGTLKMRYATDAMQRGINAAPPEIENDGYDSKAGLVLTIDRDIQQLVEREGKSLGRGAVVVMDPYTGDLLACASFPAFNPNDPAEAMKDEDMPFFNRAFAAYSVGSTFKLLTAGSALESGYTTGRSYDCEGKIEVLDQTFRCHNLAGHGRIDMHEAMNRSCNPYFISLAIEVGGQTLLYKAQQLGFGTRFEAAPGFFSAAGTLPSQQELIAPAAVGNFGFGQGVLTATPIQIATLVSSIANGGGAVTPRLVAGSTRDGERVENQTVVYSPKQVFMPQAADTVRKMAVSVVEEGSGKNASPKHLSAGGKTASAQSGQYKNGKETVHAWFSGFYPGDKPHYTIVVLAEGGESGSDAACPVFSRIADGLWELEQNAKS